MLLTAMRLLSRSAPAVVACGVAAGAMHRNRVDARSKTKKQRPDRFKSSQPLFRFGVIADVQYADIPDGTSFGGGERRWYRGSLEMLRRAVSWWRENSPDILFVAQLGDLIDGQNTGKYGHGRDLDAPQSSEAMQAVMAEFARSPCTAVHNACGNHELMNFDRRTLWRGLYADKNGSEAADPTSEDRFYYRFTPYPGWRFLLLDSYDVGTDGRSPDHPKAVLARKIIAENNPNVYNGRSSNWFAGIPRERLRFVPFNGGIGDEQLAWLRSELAEAQELGERVVLLSHVPIHPRAASYKTVCFDYPKVLKAIQESSGCVAAVISGHDHGGGYYLDRRTGCHHLTVESPLTHFDQGGAFAVAEVFPSSIFIRGFGAVPSRELMLRPQKEKVPRARITNE